ncbi:DUF4625 domain-containing protein [Labilibacter marinus]|uniref:DUF4625 domain-containing protein n=1 Tax=Labilibacter marinus TaxID=1477105 RepID=UPI00094FEECD|nr:DUF4625 domain-containing protein [Labilibacter marinus]
MKKSFIILAAIFMALSSCTKDEVDTKKPEIDVVSPEEDDHFHPGDKIHFVCNFSDDTELANYKIDIHFNSDGHEHSAQLKSGVVDDHGHEGHPWDYDYDGTFEEGKMSVKVDMEIQIPTEIDHDGEMEEVAEGEYHFGIYCLDKAGNQQVEFIKIAIEHDDH